MAVLTMIVLNYRVSILDEPQFKNETEEQRRVRVLKSKSGVSTT